MDAKPRPYEVRVLPDRRPVWRRAWRPLSLAASLVLAIIAAAGTLLHLGGGRP